MIINKNINISIFYKIKGEDIWHKLNINCEDYYDKNYHDEDEEIEIDSLPLYDNAIDYIFLENKNNIKYTKLCITDGDTNEKIIIKESYWNSQKNRIIQRIDIDSNKKVSNHEIIMECLIREEGEEKVWEIMRFSKTDEIFNPIFHSFITEDEEKLICEEKVDME